MKSETILFEGLSNEAEEFTKRMNANFEKEKVWNELSNEAEEFTKVMNADFEKFSNELRKKAEESKKRRKTGLFNK
ncbi:MAG: hypothetical protein QG657_2921 [Acidobacteriota bacterium]|nr:hypothetical protein [Acidobacteriota bacterium]